jgi:hypothetical protein
MTNLGHETNPSDARRRQIRLMQVIFAGAAAVAALTLFGAARPGCGDTAVATGLQFAQTPPDWAGAGGFATDEGVNDNGQTSGDIFTQNAQNQSTA